MPLPAIFGWWFLNWSDVRCWLIRQTRTTTVSKAPALSLLTAIVLPSTKYGFDIYRFLDFIFVASSICPSSVLQTSFFESRESNKLRR